MCLGFFCISVSVSTMPSLSIKRQPPNLSSLDSEPEVQRAVVRIDGTILPSHAGHDLKLVEHVLRVLVDGLFRHVRLDPFVNLYGKVDHDVRFAVLGDERRIELVELYRAVVAEQLDQSRGENRQNSLPHQSDCVRHGAEHVVIAALELKLGRHRLFLLAGNACVRAVRQLQICIHN